MLRSDYEIFLEKAPALISDRFLLQTWKSDPGYGLAFAKLRMRNTTYIEEAAQKSGAENGFYIDIFPYDVYPSEDKDQKWQGKRYELYRRAVMIKCGYTPWIMNSVGVKTVLKRIGYIPIRVFASFYSKEKLIKKHETMCTKFNGIKTGLMFEQAGASNYGKWVIPDNCFTEFIQLPFEDDMFSCPKNYDLYLKAAYGDYMVLPPEDKRENRHRIISVKFPEEF